MIRRLLALLPLLCMASGCVPYTGIADDAAAQIDARQLPTDLKARTYHAVDDMVAQAPLLVTTGSPAVVGSITDISDMNHSSPFGNIIADLVRSRLVQRGLAVTDMRLRNAVNLDPRQGEMMLSRERAKVYPPPAAAEFFTGTYAVANGTVYVSFKLIEADNARIIAAGDFTVPRTQDVDRLLLAGVASSAW